MCIVGFIKIIELAFYFYSWHKYVSIMDVAFWHGIVQRHSNMDLRLNLMIDHYWLYACSLASPWWLSLAPSLLWPSLVPFFHYLRATQIGGFDDGNALCYLISIFHDSLAPLPYLLIVVFNFLCWFIIDLVIWVGFVYTWGWCNCKKRKSTRQNIRMQKNNKVCKAIKRQIIVWALPLLI